MNDSAADQSTELAALCSEALGGRRLIVASNRGPVEHRLAPSGELRTRRGSGGLATAFAPIIHELPISWVSSAMGEGDRIASRQADGDSITTKLTGENLRLRYVCPPRRVYHKFYNTFCNPMLWFLQHYMWSSPYTPSIDGAVHDAWQNGYLGVNQSFADAIVNEAFKRDQPVCVMIHDYHLYLVAGQIRPLLPNAFIHHFIHIPWPSNRYWELLPAYMRTSICESLCNADIIAFQTKNDGMNFLQSCDEFVPTSEVNYTERSVAINGHTAFVKTNPQGINVSEVRRISESARVQTLETLFESFPGEQSIVRVDRAEPNKNILRGFRAYDLLLQTHAELRERVKFLAFLVPSRTHIRQYHRYLEEVEGVVKNINGKYGTPEWTPIHLYLENDYLKAITGLRIYDVLLANPVIDGMNLVAKEGAVVNTKSGVLLVSESAGVYPQLSKWVLPVAAADIEGTMQAMMRALTMAPQEKQERQALLVESIKQEDVFHWFRRQFEDMSAVMKLSNSTSLG